MARFLMAKWARADGSLAFCACIQLIVSGYLSQFLRQIRIRRFWPDIRAQGSAVLDGVRRAGWPVQKRRVRGRRPCRERWLLCGAVERVMPGAGLRLSFRGPGEDLNKADPARDLPRCEPHPGSAAVGEARPSTSLQAHPARAGPGRPSRGYVRTLLAEGDHQPQGVGKVVEG